MCQTCYDRGYNDAPNFVGSAEHQVDYRRGFNDGLKDKDTAPGELRETSFCQKCFDRGKYDFSADVWSPPTNSAKGHYESYEEGYHFSTKKGEKEKREKNKREDYQQGRYASERQRIDNTTDNPLIAGLVKICVVVAIGLAILWFVFKVVLPLIVINIAVLAVIAAIAVKDWRKGLSVVALLGTVYVFLDYNNYWLTNSLAHTIPLFQRSMAYFIVLNLLAGLLAGYFFIRDTLNERNPPEQNQSEFSKRNLITMIALIVVGVLTIFLQFFQLRLGTSRNVSSIVNESSSQQSMLEDTTPHFNNSQQKAEGEVKSFSGKVGKLDAVFILHWSNGAITGSYYYSARENTTYILKGKDLGNGRIELAEYTNDKLTANCILSLNGNCYEGKMSNIDGRKFEMNFCLIEEDD